MELALAIIMTCRGTPCIYYGTEQEFHGGNDPRNIQLGIRFSF
mgnify:CR=1 FL=1